jgi:hypothetical protein
MMRFSIVFDERNTRRVESAAERLKVRPDSLLLHFLLEKLSEIEHCEGNLKLKERFI